MSIQPRCALGIDVGGTKIAAGLVRFPEGKVHFLQTVPTRSERDPELILADVVELAERLCGRGGNDGFVPRALGLGLCELVGPDQRILSANCLDWRQLPVRQRLERIAPVTIDADVRAAARAEARFGAARSFRSCVYITVGTGISSCLLLDGIPFAGARGATGTMASSPSSAWCERCDHIDTRTLEEIAAGPALVRRFNEKSGQPAVRAEEVIAAAQRGETHARRVVESAGLALGAAAAWLINVLDPEAVIFGGGLGLARGLYWESVHASIRRHVWAEVHRQLPILQAATGPDAGVIGAAAAAIEALGREP